MKSQNTEWLAVADHGVSPGFKLLRKMSVFLGRPSGKEQKSILFSSHSLLWRDLVFFWGPEGFRNFFIYYIFELRTSLNPSLFVSTEFFLFTQIKDLIPGFQSNQVGLTYNERDCPLRISSLVESPKCQKSYGKDGFQGNSTPYFPYVSYK